MPEITLREWNERQVRPRCIEQVRRWVREHRLYPPPRLDGRKRTASDVFEAGC